MRSATRHGLAIGVSSLSKPSLWRSAIAEAELPRCVAKRDGKAGEGFGLFAEGDRMGIVAKGATSMMAGEVVVMTESTVVVMAGATIVVMTGATVVVVSRGVVTLFGTSVGA